MFGFFEDDEDDEDDDSITPHGEEIDVGGCDYHHFTEYTELREYRSEVQGFARHFNDSCGGTGEWVTYESFKRVVPRMSDGVVDQKRVAIIEQKTRATCEHEGCHETDVEWVEVDEYVFDEHLESDAELRDEYDVGDSDD